MLQEKHLAHNTISTYTKHLDFIFRWCVKQKYTDENIITPIAEQTMPVRPVPEHDLKKIFEHFRNSDYAHQYYLVRLLYLTGFRISTLITLNVDHIDFNMQLIYYRNVKGNKNSLLPMHKELRHTLEAMIKELRLKNGERLFPYRGKDSLKFFPRAMRDKLKMKYTLHQLRKTHATTLINNNIDLYDAKIILDHSDVKTTQRYYILAQMDRIRNEMSKVKFVKGNRISVQKPVQTKTVQKVNQTKTPHKQP
jgi:integrase